MKKDGRIYHTPRKRARTGEGVFEEILYGVGQEKSFTFNEGFRPPVTRRRS